MEGLLLVIVVALGIVLADTRRRLGRAERRIEMALRGGERLDALESDQEPMVVRRRPPPFAPPPAVPVPASAAVAPPEPAPRPAPPSGDLESLIGGRLPIWIGGVAIVLAGFFLVRAAIDSGWFGPGIRVALAALLAIILAGASEAARRLPATRDDARVGQVLAGAAVASAYGTLYLAAALYHLIAPLPAFILLLAITGVGLGLALRHGPPTALMALVGGFLAPLVAGYDAVGLAPLLVYLALLLAALFVLAVRRRWSWLAATSAAAGFGWTGFLTYALEGGDRPLVGGFIVLLALAASLAVPASGGRGLAWRIAPMTLGLAQLFVLAPILDFSPLGWSFYLVLGAASVALAWRDSRMVPATLIAAMLVLVLLALAPPEGATLFAALVATTAFGGAGFARSRDERGWALLAIAGLAGPTSVLQLGTPLLLSRPIWAFPDLFVAAAAVWLAWRHRDRIESADIGLIGGALTAAGFTTLATGALFGETALGIALALGLVAVDEAAWRVGSRTLAAASIAILVAALFVAARPLGALIETLLVSLPGEELTYPHLPPFADVLRFIAPIALAALLTLRRPEGFGAARRPAAIIAGSLAAGTLYALSKQPLAIDGAAAFARCGFIERAAITLAALGIARALLSRAPAAARIIAIAAFARIAWYDLIVLSPVFADQDVGGIPLVNMAVLLPAIAAAIAWTWPGRAFRIPALALMLVAALAAVRQAAHGAILTGPVGTGENWGYSAAMLVLAMIWLWRGLIGGARDLRYAGLGLSMLVALKVFTIDIALDGLLRVVSFLGIGVTLIAISWAYTRFLKRDPELEPQGSS